MRNHFAGAMAFTFVSVATAATLKHDVPRLDPSEPCGSYATKAISYCRAGMEELDRLRAQREKDPTTIAIDGEIRALEPQVLQCQRAVADMQRRRNEKAQTATIAALTKIPEDCRTDLEQERIQSLEAAAEENARGQSAAEAERRAADEAERKRLAHLVDPKWAQPFYSAQSCALDARANSYRDGIASHRAFVAKVQGVLDYNLIRNLQNAYAGCTVRAADHRAKLAVLKLKPLPCSNALVKKLMSCVPVEPEIDRYMDIPAPKVCETTEVQRFTALPLE